MTTGTYAAIFVAIASVACGDHDDRVWSLVVSVDAYSDSRVPAPPKALEHATELVSLLQDESRVPGAAGRTRFLRSQTAPGSEDLATANNIRAAFADVAHNAEPADLLVVVLLATAVTSSDEIRWLAVDAHEAKLPETTILDNELFDLIESTRCRRVLLIFDTSLNLAKFGPPSIQDATSSAWPTLRGLEGPGRMILAPNDGHPSNLGAWSQSSERFFGALLEGWKGAADREGGEADSWISAMELAGFLTERIPDALVAGELTDTWLAIDPRTRPLINRRRRSLEEKGQGDGLDPTVIADARELLEHMPRFDEDRALRTALLAYLEGKKSAEEFATLRSEEMARRRLPEEDSEVFARTVADAWSLIKDRHIEPERAGPALVHGLRGLADMYGQARDSALQRSIDQIAMLDRPELDKELASIRQRLGRRPEIPERAAVDAVLSSTTSFLDPYSTYVDPEAYRLMTEKSEGRFTGIGLLVHEDPATKMLVVQATLPGGPAERAGIQPSDRIAMIDNRSTRELEEAADRLLGPVGTKVSLRIVRDMQKQIDVEVPREEVELESVIGYRRNADGTWSFWVDSEGRIGYVRITNFAADSPDRLRLILRDLDRAGMKGLILDLRFNPGGLMTSAIAIADLFLSKGLIVRVRDRQGQEGEIAAQEFGTFEGFSIAVLINGSSASGSEIVAAALQDAGRAIVVGARSYGKGSVQDVIPMAEKTSAIKLTSSLFTRPNGANLERHWKGRRAQDTVWGVSPDEGMEHPLYPEEVMKLRNLLVRRRFLNDPPSAPLQEDPQLAKALEAIVQGKKPARRTAEDQNE